MTIVSRKKTVSRPSPMTEANRRALVVAFFLSKFDRKGVQALGYSTINEALSEIAHSLSVPMGTIKRMRDQFDPYCSRVRKGFYQRPAPRSRFQVIAAYDELSEHAMLEIVNGVLRGSKEQIKLAIQPIDIAPSQDKVVPSDANPIALRFKTGIAAEEHFLKCFNSYHAFAGRALEDTRLIGLGFDFRFPDIKGFLAVEVKGLLSKSGLISFTDREWTVANHLRDRYYLAVVRQVFIKPELSVIRDPATNVSVVAKQSKTVSITWTGKV